VTLVRTGELVAAAHAERRAVCAFNVITIEHAEAIVDGAARAGLPVVLQFSHNAVRFHHGQVRPLALATAAIADAAAVEVGVHLDHAEDTALFAPAAQAGATSAMFDPGAVPYVDNVAATRAAREAAHGLGLWLEAELGFVGGKAAAPLSAHGRGVRTDPDEARRFVADTGVDALAVAVGSSHAMTSRTARLDIDLVARLRAAVPVPLVLHGSSGVPEDELRAAIRAGISKVNIGTALNVAFTSAVRDALAADPEGVDPRGYLHAARSAMADRVAALAIGVARARA
jgi:fructose-bisphosphate aldolase class II